MMRGLGLLAALGLIGLCVWAMTRTVEPAPSVPQHPAVETVVDPRGKPITDSRSHPIVIIENRVPGARPHGFSGSGGATILTAEPYVDLLVTAKGYGTKRLPAVISDTEVMLEKLARIRVKVADGQPRLPYFHFLDVSLAAEGVRMQPEVRGAVSSTSVDPGSTP